MTLLALLNGNANCLDEVVTSPMIMRRPLQYYKNMRDLNGIHADGGREPAAFPRLNYYEANSLSEHKANPLVSAISTHEMVSFRKHVASSKTATLKPKRQYNVFLSTQITRYWNVPEYSSFYCIYQPY